MYAVTIFIFTHLPQDVLPNTLRKHGFDKLEHVLAYGVMTFLFIKSLRFRVSLLLLTVLFFAISSLGAIDEFTQTLVNRVASPIDWLADIFGIITILFFSYFKYKTWTDIDI